VCVCVCVCVYVDLLIKHKLSIGILPGGKAVIRSKGTNRKFYDFQGDDISSRGPLGCDVVQFCGSIPTFQRLVS
jgi:hypothetical protein